MENRAKHNKKIFLLISLALERMSKAGFSADSNTTDTISSDPWHRIGEGGRKEIEGNIKPLYSHLNGITSLIVYPGNVRYSATLNGVSALNKRTSEGERDCSMFSYNSR